MFRKIDESISVAPQITVDQVAEAAKLGGYGAGDPIDRAAWMLVARAVMNLDETVVKR